MRPGVYFLLGSIGISSMLLSGCSSTGSAPGGLADVVPTPPSLDLRSFDARADLQLALDADAAELRSELEAFDTSGDWRKRGYFSAAEHDDIEGLLFQLLANRTAFWGEFDRLGGLSPSDSDDEVAVRAHVLALHCGFALADTASFLVTEFANDPVAIAKLDEAFYRSEIPAGTYDRLRLQVTSASRQKQLATAWALHEQELRDSDSALSLLASGDSHAGALLAEIAASHGRVAARIEALEAAGAGHAPISHSELGVLGRSASREFGGAAYATRALLFKDVSRIKSPTAHLIRFSADQKEQLHATLEPGDLIITYTAGYISDVFIPGRFKHGITYVGGSEQRAPLGLDAADARNPLTRERAESLAVNLARDVLPDGSPADVIEAVAEGVKFSNLDHILDTHINRLFVLRPRLTQAERAGFLVDVFGYLGDPYDFRFDFADASRQVCTEVIYRALNGRGGIDFALTQRAGHPTLSADDVVNYHLSNGGKYFDVVLFAEEDPNAQHHEAHILTGDVAERRIEELMADPDG